MFEYIIVFRCELAPRDKDFVDHIEFANSLEEAQDRGCHWVDEISQYPMNAGYSVYKLVQ